MTERPFPLRPFAKAAFAYHVARPADGTLDPLEVPNVDGEDQPFDETLFAVMARRRLILVRDETPPTRNPADPTPRRSLRGFRHEKIREFFVLQAVLHAPEQLDAHLDDPRFCGVVVLAVSKLPEKNAKALRERVIQRAAESHDMNLLTAVVAEANRRFAASSERE